MSSRFAIFILFITIIFIIVINIVIIFLAIVLARIGLINCKIFLELSRKIKK